MLTSPVLPREEQELSGSLSGILTPAEKPSRENGKSFLSSQLTSDAMITREHHAAHCHQETAEHGSSHERLPATRADKHAQGHTAVVRSSIRETHHRY
jgi:hypothetical protein